VGQSEIGLRLENVDNVILRNCNIVTFNQGLYLKNVTNSLIEDNSFLKNRIGIRMINAYENIIERNDDKSLQVAVSSINSKFNTIIHENKNIERSFCEVNACNEYKDMNVCQKGDFYCSKKCTPKNDPDCGPIINETVTPVKNIIEEVEQVQQITLKTERPKIPLSTKLIIFIIAYFATFAILHYTKKR